MRPESPLAVSFVGTFAVRGKLQMNRKPIAPSLLVHQMSRSSEQTLAVDYKLGLLRLGRKAQNAERCL